MSPSEEHHRQDHYLSVSSALARVDLEMMELGRAQAAVRDLERIVGEAMLNAVLECHASKSQLARVTGYSRRQVGRLLRKASDQALAEQDHDEQLYLQHLSGD